jgi:hypothetical protein
MISKLPQRIHRATSRKSGTLGYPSVVANPQSRRRVVARQKELEKSSGAEEDTSRLTHVEVAEREAAVRPLEFGLIRRVFTYMRPYHAKRNWLLVAVTLRAMQMPALAALFTAVINGPLVERDVRGTLMGAAAFFAAGDFYPSDDALSLQMGIGDRRSRCARPAPRCVRAPAENDDELLP